MAAFKRLLSILTAYLFLANMIFSTEQGHFRNYNEFGIKGGKLNIITQYRGETEIEGFIGSTDIILHKKTDLDFAPYIYGRNTSHLEFGTGFGISGHGIPAFGSKIGLTEFDPSNGFHFHMGLEPLHVIYSANANAARQDYIEWQPMGSLGFRLNFKNMQWLILGRAGASVGTLGIDGDSGGRGAFGVSSYAILFDAIDISAEITRILAPTTPIDLWDFDMSFKANKRISIGLHAQAILIRDPSRTTNVLSTIESSELTEHRFYGSIRMAPFKFLNTDQAI